MIYAYDILCNLNDVMFDFYDWSENDKYTHLRRVPVFKVSENALYDLITKKVKINDEFLLMIKDKTQVFSNRNVELMLHASVFSDGYASVLIEFSKNGYSLRKSKFIINEEMEILEITNKMKITNISYNIVRNTIIKNNMIRSEQQILNNILAELERIKDDKERIDYLYFEWFDNNDGINKYNELVKSLKHKFTNKHEEFLSILNLLMVKK